jgi:glutamate-5-semialdehyde dehydrogenase
MDEIVLVALRAKEASRKLAAIPAERKNTALTLMAEALQNNKERILEANRKDVEAAKSKGMPAAIIDRLTLNDNRVKQMVDSLMQISEFRDPVGRVLEKKALPNGLKLKKVSTPIGVVAVIYESRPNVTSDIAGLCLKSGNVSILKGGSEAINSNRIIARLLINAAKSAGLPDNIINFIDSTNREIVIEMLKLNEYIDLVMPRGGDALIKLVAENSKIPVIKHWKGICHVYVDSKADIDMAIKVSVNAKCQRPGVCNAMETLLVARNIAKAFLPKMISEFKKHKVLVKGCEQAIKIVPGIVAATEDDWKTEYLDLIVSIKVVEDVDDAIRFINKYGTGHSDSIITKSKENAKKFVDLVDSAAVYVNASTRFTDGAEFGLGAEVGISTQKLHARGPVGANELTSYKYIIEGTGQVRG